VLIGEHGAEDRRMPVPQRQADDLLRMSTDQQDRTGSRWTWLFALPVLCRAGHAVLLALGAGSFAAVTRAVTGGLLLDAVGGVVRLEADVVMLVRRRAGGDAGSRRPALPGRRDHPGRSPSGSPARDSRDRVGVALTWTSLPLRRS
jgi:hypothetical protein